MTTHYPLTRRRFIKTVAIGTGSLAVAGSLTGCSPAQFRHGVASGDPLQDRAVIWTRASAHNPNEAVLVRWVVATDKRCKRIVGAGTELTDASRDFTVKLDVTGLKAGTTYYYQFFTSSDASPIGRMRTLPSGSVSAFSMAVLSCSNYPAGYFHVYEEVAKREDIDAVLHLGDYIYEYAADGYASEDAANLGRSVVPEYEIISLTDYRQRHAQYRADKALQAAHQQHSFICVWDDHEITNDTWRDGAENHNDGEGDWEVRKANAIQAYYEWMPVREPEDGYRERLYRRFQIGDLLDLHMLDTRVIGRDQQLDYANYIDPTSGAFNALQFQADLANPNRTLLGYEQLGWLQQGLAASSATWQVLGQQVLMGRMNIPAPLVTFQISFDQYAQLVQLAQTNPAALTAKQQAILAAPSIPYNLDAWDGYFVERETLLETARATDSNLVVLAGDTHNAWANNLQTLSGTSVGVELATASVTSPGLEGYFPDQNPDVLAGVITQLIDGLQYANLQHRGYMVVHFSHQQCRADWQFVSTIKSLDYALLSNYQRAMKTLPGAGNRTLVDA